uniref:Uncharacterized protein n=1 Tax=Palpitomonas bilix TaxID=652834 RepID=A0A7S3D0K6_9EUKA|mmetsp:Transcript_1725/g.3633  ORF Transcript_1725/g.3633 Transcript_1725/m.3633 type:complete len:412 (+) Transcript_1725:316-1551(+)|eukprot:CAMPEP_0113870086 /NCGR_PEP_ID=MMETSP0780_2-20120614/1889_1 /TAXON_ID=652834 /ORGANISM="Palpitomonas bilix" /LENGTH=411 /DNA_ID=CAMNT_0000855321 /DNA_START=314 /DNA_END=1549 /DNA_ORIENTATION=+ /assembly_acc=CAM_ASM_000599
MELHDFFRDLDLVKEKWVKIAPKPERDAFKRLAGDNPSRPPTAPKTPTTYEALYSRVSKYAEDMGNSIKVPQRKTLDVFTKIMKLYRDLVPEDGLQKLRDWCKNADDQKQKDLLRVFRSIRAYKQVTAKGSLYRESVQSAVDASKGVVVRNRPASAALRQLKKEEDEASARPSSSRPSSAPGKKGETGKREGPESVVTTTSINLASSVKSKMSKSTVPLAWGNPSVPHRRDPRQQYGRTWDASTFEPATRMLSKAQMHRHLSTLTLDGANSKQGKQTSSYYRDFCNVQRPTHEIGADISRQLKERMRGSTVPLTMSKSSKFVSNYEEGNRQVEEAFKSGTLPQTAPLTLDLYSSAAVGAVTNLPTKDKNLALLERKIRKAMYERKDDPKATIGGASRIPKLEFMPVGQNRY